MQCAARSAPQSRSLPRARARINATANAVPRSRVNLALTLMAGRASGPVREPVARTALRTSDQARTNADRQHVFIASFVPPRLPEEALYPRRWRTLGTVALMAFAVWGIGGLSVQSIRDHLS